MPLEILVVDDNQRTQLIAAHARWDEPGVPHTKNWLSLARSLSNFAQIVEARLQENSYDSAALEFKQ